MSATQQVVTKPLPLEKIVTSHNPRKPLKKLQDMGIEPMAFVHEYALSGDPEKMAHFVSMIKENQPEIWDMAATMADLPYDGHPADVEEPGFTVEVETPKMQIQPIIVRYFNAKIGDGHRVSYETRYGIAAGERRFIACALIQAVLGKKHPVLAIIKKLTVQQAYWIGVEENLQREDMWEDEKGLIFCQWAKENGQGDVPAPWTEVAKHFNRPYHEVRGRAALANLNPARLALYHDGKINLTDAINEALGESADRTKPSRKGTREVPLSIKEMQILFDNTSRINTERLRAIAECMKKDLSVAIEESDQRFSKPEPEEVNESSRRRA